MLKKKQKQYLKGLANPLKATVIIGKSGLDENILINIDADLTAHELVKISVLPSCDVLIEELVLDILAKTASELISQLGKKIVIYRHNPKNQTIFLPR